MFLFTAKRLVLIKSYLRLLGSRATTRDIVYLHHVLFIYSEKTDSVRECSRLLGSRATRGVSRSTKRAWFQLWQRLPRVRLRWSNRTSYLRHASQIVSHRPPRLQVCCCVVWKTDSVLGSQAMFLFPFVQTPNPFYVVAKPASPKTECCSFNFPSNVNCC